MRDFDDFCEWFNSECADELARELERAKRPVDGLEDKEAIRTLTSNVAAAIDTKVDFKLRKYHEWLSSQL